MSSDKVKNKSIFFILLFTAFIITKVPIISIPFLWLETYFHEISHAFVSILTGGKVIFIKLYINGSGLCQSSGGINFLISFAGYFGASLFGVILFYLASSSTKNVKFFYGITAFTILLTAILWGDSTFTIAILIVISLIFIYPIRYTNSFLSTLLKIIGLVVLLNSINSPIYLIMGNKGAKGDASALANLTLLPEMSWIFVWIIISLYGLYLCYKKA